MAHFWVLYLKVHVLAQIMEKERLDNQQVSEESMKYVYDNKEGNLI